MATTMRLIAEFSAGALFGAALLAAGVSSPETIKAQMSLSDYHMVQVMIAASAASAIAVHFMDWLGTVPIKTRMPRNRGFFLYDGNVVGGALIGVGMAVTGACPGTALIQAATGSGNGVFVVLGGIVGVLAYVRMLPHLETLQPRHQPQTSKTASSARIQDTFGISTTTVLVIWETICITVLATIATLSNKTSFSHGRPVLGGSLIGLAQLATLLLARHSIGCSTSYLDIGTWLSRFPKTQERFPFTPAVAFSTGVMAGSKLLSTATTSSPLYTIEAASSPSTALVGGAAMVFGARLAGGCTSGHGISGLVTFSWASFVTVAAMFGSGVLTAAALG